MIGASGKAIIITEKPSVAREYREALGHSENIIITSAIGHMLEVYEPEEYNSAYKKWDMELLPILPNFLKRKPIKKTVDMLNRIKEILYKADAREDIVYIATDPGREGELIGREILEYAGIDSRYRIKRIWNSEALTKESIVESIRRAKDIKEYDGVYHKGLLRQHIDWYMGINYTRALTIKTSKLHVVGRVQTAIVGIINKKHREIMGYVKSKYYTHRIIFNTRQGEAWVEEIDEEDKYVRYYTAEGKREEVRAWGTVVECEIKKEKESPPTLHNITSLQIEMNKKYGYTANETMEMAQRLYEEYKILSYPRTPSKYMSEEDYGYFIKQYTRVVNKHNEIETILVNVDNKNVFDNKKVEDHHALITIGEADVKEKIGQDIIKEIEERMILSVKRDNEYSTTTVRILMQESRKKFKATIKKQTHTGWKKIQENEDDIEKDEVGNNIQGLVEGMRIEVKEEVYKEHETTKPKQHTEATLLAYLEQRGIGTPATRAGIIEQVIKRKCIRRHGKNIEMTEEGLEYIDVIEKSEGVRELLNDLYTSKMEQEIETGAQEVVKKRVMDEINKTVDHIKNSGNIKRSVLGICPRCGKEIKEGKANYYCTGYKEGCQVKIWKEMRGIAITEMNVKELLKGNTITKKSKGRSYKIVITKEGVQAREQ